MPKRLRNNPIYLAPKIYGYRDDNGAPIIQDELTGKLLVPWEIDDKIIIYERQVKEWFLNRGSSLLKGKNNGFIILMIGASYIEGVEQYRNGVDSSRGQSKVFFKDGLQRIFSLSVDEEKLNDFYKHVRCGLFHNGMSGSQVVISNSFVNAIEFSVDDTININPQIFLRKIREDFSQYILLLKEKENVDLRDNFSRMFSVE